jgi:putative cardiolipin synthase
MRTLALLLGTLALAAPALAGNPKQLEAALRKDWHAAVDGLLARRPGHSALFVMDRGEHALRIRAWLAGQARRSLDVQYFIWSQDNVGRLSHHALLEAARRGVRCRVLIDDFMLEGPYDLLLALDAHPNIAIKVYNPGTSVGVGFWRRWRNVVFDFRRVNQRMHHKTFIADGKAGITGGRNMADEYYDFHDGFNFRDRDILVAGPALGQMQGAFDAFWDAPQSVPVAQLLPEAAAAMGPESAARHWAALDALAADPRHFDPEVRRAIEAVPAAAADLLADMDLCPARFIGDEPGKNDGSQGLGGGGESTRQLAAFLRTAQRELLIQSPYLILSDEALALFKELIARGVTVRISTNSAANNDNLQAIAGYQRQRRRLLDAGIRIHEQRPLPANMARRMARYGAKPGIQPIFVMHAKSAVVDRRRVFVGTFNLDPRSMNLNTEAGILAESPKLAQEVALAIEEDMLPENSWDAAQGNGDAAAPWGRRLQLIFWRRLPIEAVL